MTEGHLANPPSRKTLLVVLAGALLAASAIVLGAILPAEYHIDPLGIGRATGLLKLSTPTEAQLTFPVRDGSSALAHFYSSPLRTDSIDIALPAGTDSQGRNELEWKVHMRTGDTLVYSWSVDAPREEFYFDFHGQSDPSPQVKVLTYREGLGNTSSGAMTAPFDGIHGWYLQNQSERPVIVHMKLSGFYEMRPDPYASE